MDNNNEKNAICILPNSKKATIVVSLDDYTLEKYIIYTTIICKREFLVLSFRGGGKKNKLATQLLNNSATKLPSNVANDIKGKIISNLTDNLTILCGPIIFVCGDLLCPKPRKVQEELEPEFKPRSISLKEFNRLVELELSNNKLPMNESQSSSPLVLIIIRAIDCTVCHCLDKNGIFDDISKVSLGNKGRIETMTVERMNSPSKYEIFNLQHTFPKIICMSSNTFDRIKSNEYVFNKNILNDEIKFYNYAYDTIIEKLLPQKHLKPINKVNIQDFCDTFISQNEEYVDSNSIDTSNFSYIENPFINELRKLINLTIDIFSKYSSRKVFLKRAQNYQRLIEILSIHNQFVCHKQNVELFKDFFNEHKEDILTQDASWILNKKACIHYGRGTLFENREYILELSGAYHKIISSNSVMASNLYKQILNVICEALKSSSKYDNDIQRITDILNNNDINKLLNDEILANNLNDRISVSIDKRGVEISGYFKLDSTLIKNIIIKQRKETKIVCEYFCLFVCAKPAIVSAAKHIKYLELNPEINLMTLVYGSFRHESGHELPYNVNLVIVTETNDKIDTKTFCEMNKVDIETVLSSHRYSRYVNKEITVLSIDVNNIRNNADELHKLFELIKLNLQ